jgi:dihydrofolate synthase/folylpolyglutamate synthase
MKPVSTWQDLLEWSPPAEPGREARLRRFEAVLRTYQRRFGPLPAVVKVTGTSGKGSVGALLEAALLADGRAVGLFTSPHLILPTERIRVGGRDVSLEALDGAVARTGPFLQELVEDLGPRFRPSFYEALLVLAFRLFAEAGCGIAVMEAAIGGAHDVLSRVPGSVSAITSVGLDHRDEIGPELADIARDKAGIATPGSTLVLGPTVEGVARGEIERSAERRSVRLVDAAGAAVRAAGRGVEGHDVEVATETGTTAFRLPLAGDFQVDNLKTAFTVLRVLKDLGEVVRLESIAGVAETRWPARLEYLPGRPAWLLDSAHNELGFQALSDFLSRSLPGPKSLLLGASDARKAGEALDILGPLFPAIHLVGGFFKAVDPRLLREAPGSFPDPESAVRFLRERHAGEEHCVVVAGSLYLAGACRAILLR